MLQDADIFSRGDYAKDVKIELSEKKKSIYDYEESKENNKDDQQSLHSFKLDIKEVERLKSEEKPQEKVQEVAQEVYQVRSKFSRKEINIPISQVTKNPGSQAQIIIQDKPKEIEESKGSPVNAPVRGPGRRKKSSDVTKDKDHRDNNISPEERRILKLSPEEQKMLEFRNKISSISDENTHIEEKITDINMKNHNHEKENNILVNRPFDRVFTNTSQLSNSADAKVKVDYTSNIDYYSNDMRSQPDESFYNNESVNYGRNENHYENQYDNQIDNKRK